VNEKEIYEDVGNNLSMNKEEILQYIDNYLSKFNLIKVKDSNIQLIDSYYTDERELSYVIACSIFKSKESLLSDWERQQNIDIAAYLQAKKYAAQDVRWDMYFLLINMDEEIKIEEYLNIERDRFCCKKLLINASNKLLLKRDLNQKLPFTDEYYPSSPAVINTDEYFFDKLREIMKLNAEIFNNELFRCILENEEQWCELLKEYEVSL